MDSLNILTEHLGQGLGLALLLSLPPVLTAASVGLVVGILQAVTQVQEQTIAAAPKILAVFLILLLGGGLMMTMLTNYIRESVMVAFQEIPMSSDFVLPPREYNNEGRNRARAFSKAQSGGDANAIEKLKMSPGFDNAAGDARANPGVHVNSARYRSPLGPAEKMVLQEKEAPSKAGDKKVSLMFDASMQAFTMLHKQFGPLLDTGLLIFARTLAFVVVGPIFNRRNMPMILKVVMAMFLTVSLLWMVPVPKHMPLNQSLGGEFMIQIIINITIGAVLGFGANMLLLTISAAGNMLNNQIGLSSAMLLDPSTGTQTMVLEPLFNMIGTLLFIHLGGLHWMINALKRSCQTFPVYQTQHDALQLFNLDYLVNLSGDTLRVAVELVAPVMVVTIAVDIILGIVNRSAQQMPVFQLSFALKPAIGVAILLMTLPILISSMSNFLVDHALLF